MTLQLAQNVSLFVFLQKQTSLNINRNNSPQNTGESNDRRTLTGTKAVEHWDKVVEN